MDIRQEFAIKQLKDTSARILEMGPLNRPIVDKKQFPNCRYCDIRSTEDVKALYSGNAYLEATGISVDTDTIVEIDDVINENYTKTYEGKEKFDAVIASHVLEHMDDLIFALQDIAGILKPGGLFIIVYPDKRYCFDHFRQSASIRDAYTVFRHGAKHNVPMVLDFYLNAIHENDPLVFWRGDDLANLLSVNNEESSLTLYEEAINGKRMDDVHYWPFTDWDFLLFLRDCARLKLLPFRCVDFVPTQENDQQFFIALQYDPELTVSPQNAIESFERWLSQALPHYYTSKVKEEHILCQQQAQRLVQCENEIGSLRSQLVQCESQLNCIENSTIWRMTKPLRGFLDFIKGKRK